MALFTVVLPAAAKTLLHDGITDILVEAVNSADALVKAKAVSTMDNNVVWDNAVVTEVVQDLEGCVCTIAVYSGAFEAEYTGLAGDTWNDVGVALEVLCEVTYTSSWTPEATHGKVGTLLIATGTGVDDKGDKAVVVTATGPLGEDLTAVFFANIVDEGASTDDLTVDILADCPTPRVIGSYKN